MTTAIFNRVCFVGLVTLSVCQVGADLATALDKPIVAGCDTTDADCVALDSSTAESLDDLATVVASAKACAASKDTCSVSLGVTVTASTDNLCSEKTGLGVKLGSLPAGWSMEPSLTSSVDLDNCVPTGGLYSDDGSEDVCDGTSGTTMTNIPTYASKIIAMTQFGPNVYIQGCPAVDGFTLAVKLTATYAYGQDGSSTTVAPASVTGSTGTGTGSTGTGSTGTGTTGTGTTGTGTTGTGTGNTENDDSDGAMKNIILSSFIVAISFILFI